MKPKIIRTETDHAAALQRVAALMESDPAPASDDGEELDLLSLLVERYEEEKYPMDLPDPLSAIRFRMEQQGLKNKDLVPFIGSPSKVSEVLSGQRNLSLTMIRSLVKGLGIPAEALIGEPGAKLKPDAMVEEFRRCPVAAMVKRGWFPGFTGTVPELKSQIEDWFARFLGPLEWGRMGPAFHRQHIRSGRRQDQFALAAWRIRVMNLALKEKLPAYRPGTVTAEWLHRLAQLSDLNDGPKLAVEFLNKSGMHLLVEPHLPKTQLDGAAIKMPDGSPLVALTLRHDRLDNYWFTLFHELAHVALHLDHEEFEVFYDELEDTSRDQCEKDADAFALDTLIPAKAWQASGLPRSACDATVVGLANRLHISPAIPAGRVRHEKKNFFILKHLIGQGKVRGLFPAAQN